MHYIRNIALAGKSGAGKTTLVERLLYATGSITSMGEIERGTMHSDYDPQSRQLKYSIDSSLTHFDIKEHRVNLIDTPGTADFLGRYISILPAVETVAMVVNAQEELGILSNKKFSIAQQRKKCRLIIVNKIDNGQDNLEQLVEDIQTQFGRECLPINLPDKDGESVVDCYFEPDYERQSLFSQVSSCHDALIDQVVEVDEELMEVYLEQGQQITPEQLHGPFEQALRSDHLVPICFVSAQSGAGIELLLRILTELMPTPAEGNPPLFFNHEQSVTLIPDKQAHVLGHVFKVMVDPYMGRLALVRLFQGTVTADTQLYIGHARKPFKVAHLFQIQGNERKEVKQVVAGDICAIAKVDELEFDNVLHDSHDEDFFHLQSLDMPPPMISLALAPTRRGDEQKMSEVLRKIVAEDPSLQLKHRVNLNETLLAGVGDMHLQIALDKMQQQFHLEVNSCAPSIDYRESITKPAEGHFRHKKQTGGAGQFGEVYLRIAPLEAGEGFRFVNKVVGGAIPGTFIPAVEKGVRQIMEEGAIAGFPMQDLEVIVYDGKHHSVDSKEIAFIAAGRKAFLAAVSKADPIVLEPIVNLHVSAQSQVMGSISKDMAAHRGAITNTRADGNEHSIIECQVPLVEINDYSHRLKSMTGGTGSFMLEFSHFEPVPIHVQKKLSKEYQVKELG